MCECCNGNGHEFMSRNMQCKIVIRGTKMSVCLPNNAIDINVETCPMCGRRLVDNNLTDVAELRESLGKLHTAVYALTSEMEKHRRTALDVAKYVVNTRIAIGHPISPSCLQYVVYELYKAALRRGKILFYEDFQACPIGPRLPDVYDHFCTWGAVPITMHQNESDVPEKQIPDELKDLFSVIVCATAKISLHDWVETSHRDGAAWSKSYSKNEKNWISRTDILKETQMERDPYEELLNQMRDEYRI